MSGEGIFILIVAFILVEFVFDKVLDFLNAKSWDTKLPDLVSDLYDDEKYQKAKDYAKANGKLGLISAILSLAILLAMLFLQGFAKLDFLVREWTSSPILQSLYFFGILSLASSIIQIPFSWYSTFVIEEKYGFNKTTKSTFILDFLKGLALSAVIGGLLLSALVWVFNLMPDKFWWIAWLIVTAFSLFFMSFYTTLIVPLFNKLEPLEEGSLRSSIEAYAKTVDFPLTNIFVIDGSKRSNKANAYFSGIGKKKAIVLYDTLMKDNTEEELTAILAHEVGHYKMKHVQKSLILSVLQTGVLLFIFGSLASSTALASALGTSEISFHIALLGFSMLYSPISLLTGIAMNMYSRKNEYEADAFAKKTYQAESLMSALKKLSVNHLSNLTPNKIYTFVHYSHPPLVQRLKALLSS